MSFADDSPTFSVLEFQAALENISDADSGRLEKRARILAWKTGDRMSPGDLMNEAVLRTLGGRRNWKRGVDLCQHLAGAMRSIASHTELPPEWRSPGPDLDDVKSSCPAPDDEDPPERDAVGMLRRHFEDKDDDEALLVLDEMEEEKTPPEIRASLGLEQKRYEAIMKAIRRAGERLGASEGRKKR